VHRSPRLASACLALLLPFAALGQTAAPAGSTAAVSTPPARFIHVGGEGKVSVPPDVARVAVGEVTSGKDLGKVTQDAAAGLRKVLAALAKVGIAEKDVRTTRHDVAVERPWNGGKPGPITGYTVNDQVQVTVRDLSKLGAVLEQVTRAGGNTVDSLSMDRDDPTLERARALALAYAAARTKAEALARAAGVTLGEVMAIEEATAQRVLIQPVFKRTMLAESASAEQGAPVSAGELEVSGTVEVTFGIR